jgi:hypothetical protein
MFEVACWLVGWSVYLVGVVPLCLLLLVVWRRVRCPAPSSPRPLLKPDWAVDVVYLYQFPLGQDRR